MAINPTIIALLNPNMMEVSVGVINVGFPIALIPP